MMNGGRCYRSNNNSGGGGAMPPVSKIMARFRPIAPKPASMTPSNKVDAPPACSSSSSKPLSSNSPSSSSGSKKQGRGRKRSPSDGGAQKSPSSSPRKKLKSCILRPIVPVTKVSPAPLPSAAAAATASLNRSFTTTTVENSAFPCSFASSDSSCFINSAATASSSVDMGAVSSTKAPGFTPNGRMELKTLPLLPEASLRPPSPCDSSVTSCCTSSQASGGSPERDPTALCLRPSDDQVVHEAPQNAQTGHFDTGSRLPREDDAGLDLRLLEQAYTSCPEPVALTDELNRMLWCNPAFMSTVSQGGGSDELGSPVPIFSFVLKSACRVVLWAFWKRLVFQEGGLLGPFPTKKPEVSGKKPIAPQPVRAVRSSTMQWSFDILGERQRS